MPQESLAFDMYGTLVNPIRIWTQLEQYFPNGAQRIAEIWRQKQLEYSFRLSVMEQYEDFAWVTRKALDYAIMASGQQLSEAQKQALMAQYNDLECFPDVQPGLEQLQQRGYSMVVFSNGNPAMLSTIMQAAQLNPYFQGFVSVDELRMYKPSPRVYQLVAHKLARPIQQVRLISSNPFDIIGARSAGMQVTWINRSGGLFDTLGSVPETVVETLVELASTLK